jgi:hypothetical protein
MAERGHRDWDIPRGRDRWKDCGRDDVCRQRQKAADARWSKPNAQAEHAIWKHSNPNEENPDKDLPRHRSRNRDYYIKLVKQIDKGVKTRSMHVPIRTRKTPRAAPPPPRPRAQLNLQEQDVAEAIARAAVQVFQQQQERTQAEARRDARRDERARTTNAQRRQMQDVDEPVEQFFRELGL